MKQQSMKESVLTMDEHSVSSSKILDILRCQRQLPFIVRELVLDRFLTRVVLSDEEVVACEKQFMKANNIEDEGLFQQFLQDGCLNRRLFSDIATRPLRVVRFREEKWGHLARSLYLKNKDSYDLVSYRRLQCDNPEVMQEVFFRLKDGEASWEEMGKAFGSAENSLIGPVPVSRVEDSIVQAMRILGPKKIAKPMRVGDQVAVFMLVGFQSISYSEEVKDDILRKQFELWLKIECESMLGKLSFCKSDEA